MLFTKQDLSSNQLTARGGSCVCDFLMSSKTLRSLDISGNRLGDACAARLADALQHSIGLLSTLKASKCDFGEESGRLLGVAIGVKSNLKELCFRTVFKKFFLVVFCRSERYFDRLGSELECASSSWSERYCSRFKSKDFKILELFLKYKMARDVTWQTNQHLQTVDLSWNGFSASSAIDLGAALAENKSLLDLNLANNRLFDEHIVKIAAGLRTNESLTSLKVVTSFVFCILQHVKRRFLHVF